MSLCINIEDSVQKFQPIFLILLIYRPLSYPFRSLKIIIITYQVFNLFEQIGILR